MPLWVAVAIAAAAYVARSVWRGFDFRPDLPADIVAVVALAVMLGLVAWARHIAAAPDEDECATESGREDES
jgi:hypothetical protein